MYSDGALLRLEAEYYNHTELRCFTHENQVLYIHIIVCVCVILVRMHGFAHFTDIT